FLQSTILGAPCGRLRAKIGHCLAKRVGFIHALPQAGFVSRLLSALWRGWLALSGGLFPFTVGGRLSALWSALWSAFCACWLVLLLFRFLPWSIMVLRHVTSSWEVSIIRGALSLWLACNIGSLTLMVQTPASSIIGVTIHRVESSTENFQSIPALTLGLFPHFPEELVQSRDFTCINI